MQTTRIGQAVILMMIVAMAASCAASKEYTSKLFAPRTPVVTDSQSIALSKTFPSTIVVTDTVAKTEQIKTSAVVNETKAIPVESVPVAKNINPGEVRSKRTRE